MGELASGQLVDRYRVESLLGRGGMGEVYRAYDTRLRRYVALKVIRGPADESPTQPDTPGASPRERESSTISARLAARMLREARAAAALRHPNVVTVFDVGDVNGAPYIAMELLDGAPLKSFLHLPDVPLERKMRWLTEVASALAAAHRSGFIHRDIKPDNIVVCDDDRSKVLDFGVAKVDDSVEPRDEEDAPHSGPASFRTVEGRRIGTLRYMAPEQAAAMPLDGRADQFAWGLMAYELLSGTHPSDVMPGFRATAGWPSPAPPLAAVAPDVPPAIAEVIDRAVERLPEDRYPSMDAVLDALGAPRDGDDAAPPDAPGPALDAPTTLTQAPSTEFVPTAVPRAASWRRLAWGIGLSALSVLAVFGLGRATPAPTVEALVRGASRAAPSASHAPLPPARDEVDASIADAAPTDAGPAKDGGLVHVVVADGGGRHGVADAAAPRDDAGRRNVRASVNVPPYQTGCATPGLITSVLRARSRAVALCYENIDLTRQKPLLHVHVFVEAGAHSSVTVATPEPQAQACVNRAFANVQFPAPADPTVTTMTCTATIALDYGD